MNNKVKNIKKLFSPSALASTLATTMLLHSTLAAFAVQLCDSTDATYEDPNLMCPDGSFVCSALVPPASCSPGGYYYWCCQTGTSCDPTASDCYTAHSNCVCWCECN